MTRTFVDSGVLIAAARGEDLIAETALGFLADAHRVFVSSPFVRLEVLPKAIFNQKTVEAEFYETFFSAVATWATDTDSLIQQAHAIACNYGLAAMDALHVAAAIALNAEDLLTTEKPTKPMYRVPNLRIISVFENQQGS
ncbi:type II toxin-antitoxin system VapC family toxin [Nodosilinea sp. LEGE 07088]|uniref:type II toxin-antitoxin system VapC family toxin n=1 Tax=Nodosilinea sp. LEGE 07088 TaxID=2777968 RepID=UPI0018816326|nr:PIN domain-containing protein [Nodosilinea sp. LEGE 07088]MBE9140795.1 type II toxin-antitoxin system VapC family toxin [Nodosilinea sp. LEGE 07088]